MLGLGLADQGPRREALQRDLARTGGADARVRPGAAARSGTRGRPANGCAFEGEHYRHTLMTPFFTPPDHGLGPPPVWLAAVGPQMTARHRRGRRRPALPRLHHRPLPARGHAAGAARGRRPRPDAAAPTSRCPCRSSLVTGRDEAEREQRGRRVVRGQIAFYGSTPAYRAGARPARLGRAARGAPRARPSAATWDAMPGLIDDEVLAAFAVVTEPDRVGAATSARATATSPTASAWPPPPFDDDGWGRLVEQLDG